MEFTQLNGSWEGWFVYGTGYPEEMIGSRERFSLELSLTGSRVEGQCHDRYTTMLFDAAASIEGSYQPATLSFVKRYPCRMRIDENNRYSIDPANPSHEINYEGQYLNGWLSRYHRITGTWWIEESFVHPQGGLETVTVHGSWVMKKRKKRWLWIFG